MYNNSTSAPKITTIILLAGLSLLSLNMFLPSLPLMADDFGVDYGLISFSISGYLAVTAILQLIVGPLSDRYGRRPLILLGLIIFIFASIGAALANDLHTFLVFRVLQAGISSGLVLSRAIIRDMVSTKEAVSLLGYVSMAMALALILGPVMGGFLSEALGWRANFWVFAALGSAVFLLCWFDLGETNNQLSPTFLKQFSRYPEVIGSMLFWSHTLCLSFSIGAFYVFISGIPIVAASVFQFSLDQIGMSVGTITIGFFVGSFLSGRFATRFELHTIILTGRLIASVGLIIGTGIIFSGIITPYVVLGSSICAGLGNGLSLPGSNTGIMSIRSDLAGSASGLSGAFTLAAGAALTWLTGQLVHGPDQALILISIMALVSLMGLLFAFLAFWLEKQN